MCVCNSYVAAYDTHSVCVCVTYAVVQKLCVDMRAFQPYACVCVYVPTHKFQITMRIEYNRIKLILF